MRVLVTGGTGFIGGRLVRDLLERGASVRCLVRGDNNGLPDGVEVVAGDITEQATLRGVSDGIDEVYHLAAIGHIGATTSAFYEAFHKTNVVGLQNLVDELRQERFRGRFIHFSSTAAMGLISETACEESSCRPETPYQRSKYDAEQIVQQAHCSWGLSAVILRPSMVYGPGDRGSDFLSMCRLVSKGLFPVPWRREALTPLVYVDDVIRAAILAAKNGVSGETYIITSDRSYPVRELVQVIASILRVGRGGIHLPEPMLTSASLVCELWAGISRSPAVMTRKRLRSFLADRTFDISKAISNLGYKPQVDLPEGVARTVDWYKSTGRL